MPHSEGGNDYGPSTRFRSKGQQLTLHEAMGDARVTQRRAGVKRKGPSARAEDFDAMREGLRHEEAERQRKR
ncbi:hypothetical protein M758_UG273500 [Ceratodon purpureus]|nr:hypothetical protein M758_UG273500 [Ceratodon purpureus]